MTSYGSHYRVEVEDAGALHMMFNCGVAELQGCREGNNFSDQGGMVDLMRVGILKDILVLNIMLMVVSGVAKDIDLQPR